MKDYAQYTSRIPSPHKRATTTTITTKNVSNHPLAGKPNENENHQPGPASTSTASSTTVHSSPPQQPQHSSSPSSGPVTPSSSQQQRAGPPGSSPASRMALTAKNRTPNRSPSNGTRSNNSNAGGGEHVLNASDALAIRRDGTEATVAKLRNALEEATSKDSNAKAALAKSDAVILELRSSIRQLKQKMETVQQEKEEWKERHDKVLAQLKQVQQQAQKSSSEKLKQYEQQIQHLQSQLLVQNTQAKDEKVGELQIQLDRAHAQILTADMVRKELEDTLEAEQYTWELRVQDQERTIAQMQEESRTLAEDLETCRSQWKEAEAGWNDQIESLQQQLTQARTRIAATAATAANSSEEQRDLLDKITQLEQERSELQNCLDEALQELEAVDAELGKDDKQKNGAEDAEGVNYSEIVEPLQHLLRWIEAETTSGTSMNGNLHRQNSHSLSSDPKELMQQIQEHLERNFNENLGGNRGSSSVGDQKRIIELQAQVTTYKDELKSREESSAELRDSLKEAVALLKPLQDAVAKAEVDKTELKTKIREMERSRNDESLVHQQLERRNKEIQSLEEQVSSLQQQVEEHKQLATARQSLLEASTSPASASKSPAADDSLTRIQRARDELRRKRETEGNLKQLLKDAQSRFHSLHLQNEDVAARNRELQGKLKDAEKQLVKTGDMVERENEETIEEKLERYEQELAKRDLDVADLREQLEKARASSSPKSELEYKQMEDELAKLRASNKRMQELDDQLARARNDLAQKEQTERILNKSLKEALGLLRPLQMHLEDAEKEKMEISKELRNLRKRFRQLQMGEHTDDQSRSTAPQDVSIELIKIKEELEETVRQLELENSQLHDALEELSTEGSTNGKKPSDAKLRQKIVELNSRYEVTQNKLEDAHIENHALVKALKQKELDEKQREEELDSLREKLEKAEAELHNAKAIARSALVKVEELTMANVEQLSLSRDGPIDLDTSF